MNDELLAIAERVKHRRAAAVVSAAVRPLVTSSAYGLGDAVFDAVSGLEGTVLGAGLRDRLRANDVKVHLVDGRDVIRGAGELIAPPAHD